MTSCGLFWTLSVLLVVFRSGLCFCPNHCDGHGECSKYNKCICNEGYEGGDCSLKSCPQGVAWSDHASGVDQAHSLAVCSNRGSCSFKDGTCECIAGWTGKACDRLSCPSNCDGNGDCYSIDEQAKWFRNSVSKQYAYTGWDAHTIRGCRCNFGYDGFDCSTKICPDGDDPLTRGQFNEIQYFTCSGASGQFELYYKGLPSTMIHYYASAADVKTALETIPGVTNVKVTFSLGDTAVVCQQKVNVVQVEFLEQFGNIPPLVGALDPVMVAAEGAVVVASKGETMTDDDGTLFTSRTGTKEADECAYRGYCLKTEGICVCYTSNLDVYDSSDGYGGYGNRGDCGYVKSEAIVQSCPGDLQCSGHGNCNKNLQTGNGEPDYYAPLRCSCYTGWTSPDCSQRTCPQAKAWFDYPIVGNYAHQTTVECAGMGECDISTGMCSCRKGFTGEACQISECPSSRGDEECSGHGMCLSLYEYATVYVPELDLVPTTYGEDPNVLMVWDAHRIRHCHCDSGWEGYMCTERTCPYGDDPETTDDVPERQFIQCIGTGGHFTVSFRGLETAEIPYDASVKDIEDALNAVSTIRGARVDFMQYIDGHVVLPTNTSGMMACSPSSETNKVFIVVDFLLTFGNLPAMATNPRFITGADKLVRVYANGVEVPGTNGLVTSHDGTTENVPCSNRGLCNKKTGECNCFTDFLSSDGMGGPGDRGDCGYTILNVMKADRVNEGIYSHVHD